MPRYLELFSTLCFAAAILHALTASFLKKFHRLLGEVELAFALWALLYMLGLLCALGPLELFRALASLSFLEPLFVLAVMLLCSTQPVLRAADRLISAVAKAIPLPAGTAFFLAALTIGPMLGSVITEPAAMTVSALLLRRRVFVPAVSEKLKYATLGLLFVSVSIGGSLTPFAAPPVLMVARKWGWGLSHMLAHFGWKAALAILVSTALVAFRFRRELGSMPGAGDQNETQESKWMLKEGLLVASFLSGLVVLGSPQRWWLEPLLNGQGASSLFLGSLGLTAVVDNAALTFLGSQVPGLSDASKYALVAGSLVGGGLTVIANAPNPAGYSILGASFGTRGISAHSLFFAALPPTLVAAVFFWLL